MFMNKEQFSTKWKRDLLTRENIMIQKRKDRKDRQVKRDIRIKRNP